MEALGSRLEVDPGVVGKRQADLAAAFERDDLPQLRDEGAEPIRPARLAPERVVELVARDRAVPVRGEVDEGEPTLAARKRLLDPRTVDPRDEPAAELDPRLRQGFAKVTASGSDDNAQ